MGEVTATPIFAGDDLGNPLGKKHLHQDLVRRHGYMYGLDICLTSFVLAEVWRAGRFHSARLNVVPGGPETCILKSSRSVNSTNARSPARVRARGVRCCGQAFANGF